MDAAKINIQVPPIPVQHQQLVMDRVKEAREKPETMLDWNEVSKKLI